MKIWPISQYSKCGSVIKWYCLGATCII